VALIEVSNLSFTYPERERAALVDVSLAINSGDFVVLCGKSGCGKSTLLRHFKTVLTPFGRLTGAVYFDGRLLGDVSQREQTSRIGFVLQSPENQIVTDKVWHELAFGLESLGEKAPVIRRHVAEMASFFGIQSWYEKTIYELSGGQKQLLALAAVLTMQPDVLILDEPTAQLDPIAAEDFIVTLKKINDEIGTTIIMSEHRLEGALPRADTVLVMEAGRIISHGSPSVVARDLQKQKDQMLSAMPAPMRVYLALEKSGDRETNGHVPQTVREGRVFLEKRYGVMVRETSRTQQLEEREIVEKTGSRFWTRFLTGELAKDRNSSTPLLAMKDVWFRYDREGIDIIKDLALQVFPGEFVCVVGGNGTGKSTMLGVVSGENKHYRGQVSCLGLDPRKAIGNELSDAGLAALPQDPQTLFTRATVFDNLIDVAKAYAKRRGEKRTPEQIEAEVLATCEMTETLDLIGFHPYDVSGGEQQRTGMAMALLTRPQLLLLDEPTKGMDGFFKAKFAAIIKRLCTAGMGVLMVSHDVEFCAKFADRCALFFNGNIVSEGLPRTFFSGNSFYTTAANRMARFLFAEAITAEEVVELLEGME
jgi:energy-coupling factor transport system ATP-binding protein